MNRIYCGICDFLAYVKVGEEIPKDCPACGGSRAAASRSWSMQDRYGDNPLDIRGEGMAKINVGN